MSIAAGNRVGLYCVGSLVSGGPSDQIICVTRVTDPAQPSNGAFHTGIGKSATTGGFRRVIRFTGGLQDVGIATSDNNFHLFSARPLSTAASAQNDCVEMSTTFTGNDTAQAHETFHVGQSVTSSGGKFCMAMLVDVSSDPAGIDLAIRSYVQQVYGIANG